MKLFAFRLAAIGLCLCLTASAWAALDWDTSIIWQLGNPTVDRMFFGVGFHVGADGRVMAGGESGNTTARAIWGQTPLTDNWGGVASNRQSYSMPTDSQVRNGHMARLPNGNIIFLFDGRVMIGEDKYFNGYAFYDATTQTWSPAATMGTPNLGTPRVAVSGNSLTDVHVWGTISSVPSYAYYSGSDWVYETILNQSTNWHTTNYRRENAFETDSTGRPIAMVYNRTGGINALQLFTRTGADTWVADTVTPSAATQSGNNSPAAFALYNDIPYVVYMDLSAQGDGRRGQLYLTYKDGADWADPLLLDTTYLTTNTSEATAHIAINADGVIAIAYTYLEKSPAYPLTEEGNPAIGETRFILGNADTLSFSDYEVVPLPAGANYDAYFDAQLVFDYNDPLRIHLIQRTNNHATSGANLWRDAYYATTVVPEPASILLGLTGLVGLYGLKRRRN